MGYDDGMDHYRIDATLHAVAAAWSADTDYERTRFNAMNPARGQCMVSSLVVQYLLGGELIRFHVTGAGFDENHYANTLPDGTVLDATFRQYQGAVVSMTVYPKGHAGFGSVRSRLLADAATRTRYERLLATVVRNLQA